MLKGQLAGKTIDQLKSVDGVKIDTVRFVNFNNDAYVSSLSSNEATIGPSVFNLGQNELTAPMKGQSCAFVAEKISEDSYSAEFDDKAEQLRLNTISSTQITSSLIEELYYQAKVIDNRYKIF
jgi:peptidyl-prolyl cis-trans isomerase D